MALESTTCEGLFAREIMSLLKWIKVEKLVLPLSMRAYFVHVLAIGRSPNLKTCQLFLGTDLPNFPTCGCTY